MSESSFQAVPPATLHILLALADGEKHGYGITGEVGEQTAGKVVLGPGTLYGAIKRMLELGWIEEAAAPTVHDDPRRRYYRLTPSGREVLSAELGRLRSLLALPSAQNLFHKEGAA